MKKTLATLLVLAMVVSVCGMLFASAGANDAVAELKAELEALVGADVENAAGEWNVDVTVDETGKVTAVFNIAGLEDKGIVIVEAPVFYDADKLTLLNTINSKDNSIDCITVMPDDSGDWENFCSMGEIADGIGQLTLSILNVEATTYINESSLEFTLEFQLAEGESLAGLYIPSNDDNYASDESFEPMYLNGTYGIVCTIEEEPVENTKVEVNVNENAILTDGKTGFTGAWGAVGTGDVALVTNGNCTAAGMDVTLSYALGATKLIDSVTVDLYHCANVMIGYPEGQATVLVSVDGETWTEAGKYDLAAADLALDKSGTVSNTFSFTAVEAAYVKVLLYAGSNEAVLGANPAAGKIFWEFISVAEFAVNEVKIPTNLAAGKEWTGDTEIGSDYKGDITDGKIDPDGKYDKTIWYGFDQRKSGDSVGTIIIDLGAIYTNIDEIRAHVWPLGGSGIAVPQSYDFYVSKDGETYTKVTSVAGAKGAPAWVGTDNEEGLTARYVKLDIVGTAKDTFWFIGELEVNSYEPKIVEVAVPAEPGNLAAGKEWTGDTDINGAGYLGDITDGKIDPDGKYDKTLWYGFDQRKSGDSVGTIIIDLGKLYSGLDEIRAYVWHAPGAGIAVPQFYNFYISEDGETYTLVTSVAGVKSDPTWVGTDNTETLTARYVKLDIVGTDKDTFWFIGELEVNVFEPEIPHEHAYNKTVTVEPSLVDGVATYTCECGDSYTEAIPAVKVQPETLETLPEGALVFDYAGYVHDSFFCIVAGDNLTVNELTALGNNGAGKDMNYFYVIVVDENGVVVETHFTLGRPDGVKSDVVCPAGGYIIAFNGNKAGADELTKVEVGAEITLYNIDVEALRGVAGNVTVKDAGFTYENPAPVEPDEPSEPEVSEPEEPSEEPSEDDSSELPPTSDAGVLVFAILGVLAIVGAAVVIKVRN